MLLAEFDAWCRSFLAIDALKDKDDSLNGIQVGNSGLPIQRAAFAVDACAASIERAAHWGAQVLFVHHGLFWGSSARIEGALLKRISALVQADMGLYACHLPLDMNPEVGNNAVLANLLGLVDRLPFGIYHGVPIGVRGRLEAPLNLDTIVAKLLPGGGSARTVIAAGSASVSTVAIVSGGAPFEAFQAIDAGVDLYVTGEPSHSIYHQVVESGLNFIAAGHYATEIWGVRAVAEKAKRELGLETLFIDLPTGL